MCLQSGIVKTMTAIISNSVICGNFGNFRMSTEMCFLDIQWNNDWSQYKNGKVDLWVGLADKNSFNKI